MFVERESFDEETSLSDLVFGYRLARPVEPVPHYVDTPALGWLQESAWLGDLIGDIEVATENVKGHEVHFGARNQRTQPQMASQKFIVVGADRFELKRHRLPDVVSFDLAL